MPIDRNERNARETVDALRKQIDVKPAQSTDLIRAQALAKFTRELDAKLANLQDGETLQITYRVDIVGTNDKVRGGSGSARTMPEYMEWRKAVYKRDHYTCQECGAKRDLNAHHIKAWEKHPELRFDVANGVTLCAACHAKKHPHLGFNKRLSGN